MIELGKRMKEYEKITRTFACSNMPLIVRVDGRAFHSFTKGFKKPFDKLFMSCMDKAAMDVAKEIQGFKLGYVQSDEATFVMTDYDRLESQGWFNYNLSKIISNTAALMSVHFNAYIREETGYTNSKAVFDSRAFNVPADDVLNVFLWRAQDWARNSLQMYCRAHFSHNQLIKKGTEAQHNLLHEVGLNWATDLSPREKNGTWFKKVPDERGFIVTSDVKPLYHEIHEFAGGLFDYPKG